MNDSRAVQKDRFLFAMERSGDDDDKERKRARNVAYRYLTVRPRSRWEVEQKLRDREFAPDVITSVVDHLRELDYINDRSFAAQWAVSRMRSRGFGRRRIEQELYAKRIDREIVQETLRGLYEEAPELEVARKEAEKKLRTLSGLEPLTRKRRLAGHLERKGYASEIIRAVLRCVFSAT